MPTVQRVGDANTAGGVIINGIGSVRANGRPIAPVGASVSPHPCCGNSGCGAHCSAKTTATIASVRAEGKLITLSGSVDTCGHTRSVGSPNVRIGG